MPLKLVRRPGSDMFYVRGTVRGQSVYESSGTADPVRAEGYRARRENELWDRSVYGARAVVTFSAAVDSYLERGDHTPTTVRNVRKLWEHFRDRPLTKIDQEALDGAYRVILTKGAEASAATKIRHVLTPLRAILEHAAIRRWCDRPAFETPKVPRTRTEFLKPDEASRLVAAASPHLRPLLVFLIGTGARMSEALELEWKDVDLRGASATLVQKQGTFRRADLPPVVIAALSALSYREGRVFRPARGKLRLGASYMDTGRTGGGQIKTGWAGACRRAGLPGLWRVWTPVGTGREKQVFVPDLTPHCLRHTWATWYHCVHRDLLKLKEDGGWDTITMVARYAKLMPAAYQQDVIDWWDSSLTRAVGFDDTEIPSQRSALG